MPFEAPVTMATLSFNLVISRSPRGLETVIELRSFVKGLRALTRRGRAWSAGSSFTLGRRIEDEDRQNERPPAAVPPSRPPSPRHMVPDSGAERRRSRCPQRVLAFARRRA